jgi:hypothetical protein
MTTHSSNDKSAPSPDSSAVIFESEKWERFTDDDIERAIATLRCGPDPESAWFLIEYFHYQISSGSHFDPALLYRYLEDVFDKLIDKQSPDQALGLKARRGKYSREGTEARDLLLAMLVEHGRRTRSRGVVDEPTPYRDGRPDSNAVWESAVADVDEMTEADVTESTIRRAFTKHRALVEDLDDQFLASVLTDYDASSAEASLRSP